MSSAFKIILMLTFVTSLILIQDLVTAGHGGQVKIKVYRGPNHGHKFAPWGYYAHVPEDDAPKHGHGHKW